MEWTYWVYGISVGVIALFFMVLVIYLVFALRSLRAALDEAAMLIEDLHERIDQFDSYFEVASDFGEEMRRSRKQRDEEECEGSLAAELVADALHVGLLGFGLFQKYKKR